MINNPAWNRQIALSKVMLEVMLMDLQKEFEQGASVYGEKNNGSTIRSEENGQPLDAGAEIGNVPAGTT